jgi:hypothetical protein
VMGSKSCSTRHNQEIVTDGVSYIPTFNAKSIFEIRQSVVPKLPPVKNEDILREWDRSVARGYELYQVL